MKVEGVTTLPSLLPFETLGLDFPPLYDGDTREPVHDEFGTVVTEITTVTTRTRYRTQGTWGFLMLAACPCMIYIGSERSLINNEHTLGSLSPSKKGYSVVTYSMTGVEQ